MSTAFRGLSLRLAKAPTCALQTSIPMVRGFTSSTKLDYARPRVVSVKTISKPAKPAANSAAGQPRPSSNPVLLNPSATNNRLLLQLARSQKPTLLYESASHTWMKFGSYTAATTLWATAGINFWLTYTSSLASTSYAFIYFAPATLLFAMGSYFFLRGVNIVKTIRAVPTAMLKDGPDSTQARLNPVMLEVSIKPTMPFASKPIVKTVSPDQVTLSHRLFQPALTNEMLRQQKLQDKTKNKVQWEEDKHNLMTVPFRHAWRGLRAMFGGLKRALVDGGFIKLNVDGRRCRLDAQTGWALNNGLALEGLVPVLKQPTPQPRRR